MKKIAKILCLAAIIALPLQAQQATLKNVYANYFRIGTAFQWRESGLSNANMRSTILTEFNSITHEDELKPNATMVQSGSTNANINVQLNSAARNILQFCVDNNIPLRGHTLVWHSQTPNWFFWANMQGGNNQSLATVEVMNQRMESYIKNILELIKRDYPTLDLYAYDVVNEIFLDNGNPRNGGFDGDNSPWVQIYGNNSFADTAFVYARRHATTTFPNMKLFYNDFNEYSTGKRAAMVAMANRLGPNGRNVMDGIGMQSHLSIFYPNPTGEYRAALTAFRGTGLEIHVTELDITLYCNNSQTSWCNENYAPNPVPPPTQAQLITQGGRYAAIFSELLRAKNEGANITSVSLWGVTDNRSWREWGSPLLFNSSFAKKPAYDSLIALIPQSEWGDGSGGVSSSSTGGASSSSSSVEASSSSNRVQAETCQMPLIEYPTSTVPADPYTACFKYTNDKCYVCKIENEGEFEGNLNTCASGWVWDGSQIENNLTNGYWYHEVSCPDPNPIRLLSPLSTHAFKVSSLNNRTIQVESNADITIYLYNTKGKIAQKVQVPKGSSVVRLSVPSGIYIVKNSRTKRAQMVMVK
ncbi:MAG: endo-1,4-beta-xylanase [Fibromonadaceae bacterium]|jgi:GH35 family endo-1,4-beta-xylanase|nr:endo-1,4-beta-xylanase [Fibromonadaceae bacterium]